MDEFKKLFDSPTILKRVKRAQLVEEVGKKCGTTHLHFFVHFKNAKTRSALDSWTGFHWDDSQRCRGTDYENWTYTEKDLSVSEFEGALPALNDSSEPDRIPLLTVGEPPTEEGEPSNWEKIRDLIKQGTSTTEIVEMFPGETMRCIGHIEKYRQLCKEEDAMKWREIITTFITGPTGIGKTRRIMEKYGYENVYRLTNKKNPWDGYKGQDVIIFEEFRGTKHGLEDMLNYLDGYPLILPCRYSDKYALYTKVYLLTNVRFNELYMSMQRNYPSSWDAFCRRIDHKENMWNDEKCIQTTIY